MGVRLEDKENEATVIKLVDRDELMKEKAEKKAAEEKKRLEKEAKKAEAAAKAAALEAAKRMPPSEMFKVGVATFYHLAIYLFSKRKYGIFLLPLKCILLYPPPPGLTCIKMG